MAAARAGSPRFSWTWMRFQASWGLARRPLSVLVHSVKWDSARRKARVAASVPAVDSASLAASRARMRWAIRRLKASRLAWPRASLAAADASPARPRSVRSTAASTRKLGSPRREYAACAAAWASSSSPASARRLAILAAAISSVSERTRRPAGRREGRATAAAIAAASACTSGAIMPASASESSRGERSTPRSARCMTACTSCSGRLSSKRSASAVHLARSDSRSPEGSVPAAATANCLSIPSGRLLTRVSASSARPSDQGGCGGGRDHLRPPGLLPARVPVWRWQGPVQDLRRRARPASAPAEGSAGPARWARPTGGAGRQRGLRARPRASDHQDDGPRTPIGG